MCSTTFQSQLCRVFEICKQSHTCNDGSLSEAHSAYQDWSEAAVMDEAQLRAEFAHVRTAARGENGTEIKTRGGGGGDGDRFGRRAA